MEVLKNYINGEWVKSSSTETIEVLNPANQAVLAKVPHGNATAIDVATACETAIRRKSSGVGFR